MKGGSRLCGWLAVLLAFPVLWATAARGQESLCARVKIEIAQELTLEARRCGRNAYAGKYGQLDLGTPAGVGDMPS